MPEDTQGKGLDVGTFSRSVMDSYGKSQDNGRRTVYAHAATAADSSRVSLPNAVRLGDHTLRRYSELRQNGFGHLSAREQTAEEMSRRFDDRGRDSQQQQKPRHRSQGVSL